MAKHVEDDGRTKKMPKACTVAWAASSELARQELEIGLPRRCMSVQSLTPSRLEMALTNQAFHASEVGVWWSGFGDEMHLVFECAAITDLRGQFPDFFQPYQTMQQFMWQPNLLQVAKF